jgi:adenylate cyclase
MQDGDYFGRTVNLASRIAGKAGSREVLVAPEVADVCSRLGVDFSSVGAVELKGVSRPVELFRAVPGRPDERPPGRDLPSVSD